MGFGSVWHWVIVLLVVLLLFGTKKLRNVGSDLGSAIKSFRKGLGEDEPARLEPGERADELHAGDSAKPTSAAKDRPE